MTDFTIRQEQLFFYLTDPEAVGWDLDTLIARTIRAMRTSDAVD